MSPELIGIAILGYLLLRPVAGAGGADYGGRACREGIFCTADLCADGSPRDCNCGCPSGAAASLPTRVIAEPIGGGMTFSCAGGQTPPVYAQGVGFVEETIYAPQGIGVATVPTGGAVSLPAFVAPPLPAFEPLDR